MEKFRVRSYRPNLSEQPPTDHWNQIRSFRGTGTKVRPNVVRMQYRRFYQMQSGSGPEGKTKCGQDAVPKTNHMRLACSTRYGTKCNIVAVLKMRPNATRMRYQRWDQMRLGCRTNSETKCNCVVVPKVRPNGVPIRPKCYQLRRNDYLKSKPVGWLDYVKVIKMLGTNYGKLIKVAIKCVLCKLSFSAHKKCILNFSRFSLRKEDF